MVTFSLCMVVENAENTLVRCLSSALPCIDELILVDMGSTDQTRRIARTYTQKVYFHPEKDLTAARNFSFSKATMDYCLWLHPEEVFLPQDLQRLLFLKKVLPPNTNLIMLRARKSPQDTEPCYRARILRRDCGFVWQEEGLPLILPEENILCCEAAVTRLPLLT